MSYEYPSLDHSIIHFSAHCARIRIVSDDEADGALSLLQMLFPHEPIMRLPLPCRHTCIYTHSASAADVAEQVAQHVCASAGEPL